MVNFAILPLLTLRASNWDFIATNSARSVLVIYYLSNWQTPNKQKTSKWTKTKLARMKVKLMPRWSKGCGRCSCVVINGGGQWPLMMTTWLMPLWEIQILTKIPQRMLYIQEMQSTFPSNNHSVGYLIQWKPLKCRLLKCRISLKCHADRQTFPSLYE